MMENILTPPRDAAVEGMLSWVEYAATGVEFLAVAIIVVAILMATVAYLSKIALRRADRGTYNDYRHKVGRALLLGLEILVAADIIRTVVLEPTLANVLVLGLLVLIRTFLSWALVLEIEERWPWQPSRSGTKDQQT
jgi:uncharacterized membrane protein